MKDITVNDVVTNFQGLHLVAYTQLNRESKALHIKSIINIEGIVISTFAILHNHIKVCETVDIASAVEAYNVIEI
jgi:hypothetical protein